MPEVMYSCPACRRRVGLKEARDAEFLCPVDASPLERFRGDAEGSGLGVPQAKGERRESRQAAPPQAVAPQRAARPPAGRVSLATAVLSCLVFGALAGLLVAFLRLRELGPLAQRLADSERTLVEARADLARQATQIEAHATDLERLERLARESMSRADFDQRYTHLIPDIVARCEPAVVHIINQHWVEVNGQRMPRGGTGSGFFIEDRRYVVTNYHVIHGASTVRCVLFNNQTVEATIHGTDPVSDLALLRIELSAVSASEAITSASLSDRSLRPGEPVFVLGSPNALARTVTRGIASNIRRYTSRQPMPGAWIATGTFNNWIQTDTAINPGNSGGPMFSLEGKVVGVVTRKMAQAGIDNIGFALPIDYVRGVVAQLKDHRKVRRSTLGVFLQPHNPPAGTGVKGVRVLDVMPRSPVDQAGLQRDDVIVEINGQPVQAPHSEDLPEIEQLLARLPVTEPAVLMVRRGTEQRRLTPTPRVRAQSDDQVQLFGPLGFFATELSGELGLELGLPARQGLLLCGMPTGSALDQQGFRKGDVLLSLSHPALGAPQPLLTMEQAWNAISGAIGRKLSPLTFTAQRGPQQLQLNLVLNYSG